MNDVNRISKKISEIQLKSQDVNLGASQDLEKELVVLQNLQNPIAQNIDRLTNLSRQISDEKKSANDNLIKLNAAYEKSVSLHDKLKKMQGELGINLPIVETAFNKLKGAEADFKDLKTLLNQIK
jgi:hypothetical protein